MYKPEKSQSEIFTENITRIMREKGLSQPQLAEKVGVSVTALNKWVRGIATPRNDKIDALCRILNCQRSDLLSDRSEIPNLSIPAAYPIPVLGAISCGDGVLAEENFDGYFFVDNSIRADYCLRVEGDSMRDAGINHGDIAFIRKSYSFLNGGIYAVVFGEDNNAVLKKVYKQNEGLLLMPCNQLYEPLFVNDCFIVGECVGVFSPIYNSHS